MAGTPRVDVKPAAFRLDGLSHITLPVRSAQEAKRFWVGLFGAEVGLDNPNFVAVTIGGTVLDFNEFPPVEPRQVDSPHVAFFVKPEVLPDLKAHLQAHRVPLQAPWTRSGKQAHMYFFDPSGNLFELICVGFEGAADLPRPPSAGGDLEIDLSALRYDWQAEIAASPRG